MEFYSMVFLNDFLGKFHIPGFYVANIYRYLTMSFTRFHDDPARIKKQLQEMTGVGRYQLMRPGPGQNVPFIEDPHIRLQQWGANLHTNGASLETDLIGVNRKLTHGVQLYDSKTPTTINKYKDSIIENPFTDESRATHPAWMFRDLEQSHWGYSFHDVQSHTEIPFEYNTNARLR